ncbi:hypothetical protein HMPREF9080_02162 [Cardiobacterium valvarum F0432]|uniref:Uncharacterized protein n=1 Tax=Cardiobacterium valvarum F0432 TaxID=797473 RepID=G9ZHA4_9GAMM|nr:hypothetical protein HMPREF9080_02162 [Cardiobacterium valvarum F0432]
MRGGHGAAAVVDDDVGVFEVVAVELGEFAEAVDEDAFDAFGVAFFVVGVEDFEVAAGPEGLIKFAVLAAQADELDVFFAGQVEGAKEHQEEDGHDDFDRHAGVADEMGDG